MKMNTHVTPFCKYKNFLAPRYYDSRYYEHQIAVPRVSAITGVDCKSKTRLKEMRNKKKSYLHVAFVCFV